MCLSIMFPAHELSKVIKENCAIMFQSVFFFEIYIKSYLLYFKIFGKLKQFFNKLSGFFAGISLKNDYSILNDILAVQKSSAIKMKF